MSDRMEAVLTIRVADLDAYAGREVTDEEARRIEKALDFSLPEYLSDIVGAVCGYTEED